MNKVETQSEGSKLISALYELCKENFSVSDDTILEKLYVHIQEKFSENDFLELIPKFGVWFEFVLKEWSNNILCGGVKVLSIRLMGLVGSKPQGFTIMKHILHEFEPLISSSEVQNDSSLMVSLLNDLALLLDHKEGYEWVLKTGIWKHAVKIYLDNHSIYTNRSSIKFISLLLKKVGDNKETNCEEIFNCICKPLLDNYLMTITPMLSMGRPDESVKNKKCDEKLVPTLENELALKNLVRNAKYLCEILDELYLSDSKLPVKFQCNTTNILNLGTRLSPQDYQSVVQLLVMLELSNVCGGPECVEARPVDPFCKFLVLCPLGPLYERVQQFCLSLLSLGHLNNLLDYCVFCLTRIHRFRIHFPRLNSILDCSYCRYLETFLVSLLKMFLELHSTCFSTDNIGLEKKEAGNLRDLCLEGFNFSFSEGCLTKFNDIKLSEALSFQYFQLGVFATTRSVNLLHFAGSKGTISSAVMNSFDIMKNHFWSEKARKSSSLLHLITLSTKLAEISEECCEQLFPRIPWILQLETDDPRITISTIQLLNKILEIKVVSSCLIFTEERNLNTIYRCEMDCIAKSLMRNLKNHSSWEIRDTTLECYQMIIGIGDLAPGVFARFWDENLYAQVSELAAKDTIAYVRASALKFLSKVVRAKLFLDKLSSHDLCDLAVKTLLEDQMPGPRVAACDLLTAIYITEFLRGQNVKEKIYEAVYIASMKELDWEVKKASLRFWQSLIMKQLADEKVPADPVLLYYSRHSTKKEDVVQKIIRVINTLSDIGCFTVLWLDVNDDSDISVSEEASLVIDNILDLDRKWNFIQQIINTPDIRLDEVNPKNKKISSKDFLSKVCEKDWKEKLEARKNWIKNTCDDMSSLLDHILDPDNKMGDWDHNAIDCY